jgi:DNA polymerase III epsilon subunit-like protein
MADQSAIYGILQAECHPLTSLKKQGYIIQDSEQPAAVTTQPFDRYIHTPKANSHVATRRAIALDCEMVGIGGGRDEVAMICAVDFFTGETLIHSLVKPQYPVMDWRTKITGITPDIMTVAVVQRLVLPSPQAALTELWKYVDENTILVGQALHHDLKALGFIHKRVVDSSILTGEAVFGKDSRLRRRYGLQTLCEELVGLRIREGSPFGHTVHDCLEDTLSAREVVLWCLTHPAKLDTWGKLAHQTWQRQQKGRRRTKKGKAKPVHQTNLDQ